MRDDVIHHVWGGVEKHRGGWGRARASNLRRQRVTIKKQLWDGMEELVELVKDGFDELDELSTREAGLFVLPCEGATNLSMSRTPFFRFL